MNILPIPLFDGGHLFLLGVEKIRGRKLSEKTQERIGTVSFFALIILTILIMFKDVIQFNWIGRIWNMIAGILPK
jgi:regulator of sigma E protease